MSTILMILYCLYRATTWSLSLDESEFDLSYLGRLAFGEPSEETGLKLLEWNESWAQNPEELGEYAEGDILFKSDSRNGLVAETARWKDGIVPYEINGYFSSRDKQMIERAIEQYHKYTCIRFRIRTDDDRDWISIVSGKTGCWSSVGRVGGRQEVNLQSPGCFSKLGTAVHELLHALGFLHEQNRWERDEYVEINWQNIQLGKESNFEKATNGVTTGFGLRYDYNSVMHYSAHAFSKNGRPTIQTKISEATIGQRDGFSKRDIEKIKVMYKCSETEEQDNEETEDVNSNGNGGFFSWLFP